MAFKAQHTRRLQKLEGVLGAMYVVATEAPDIMVVHDAGGEVVALHPVLVRCAVREIIEVGLAEFPGFELPIILQAESHLIAHRPVVMLALDGILKRTALRMALDAKVVGVHIVEPRRIDYVLAHRPPDVLAARAVATLAAHIPFRYRFGV